MGCNCKKEINQQEINEETNAITSIFKYILKFFIFSFSLIFSPIALIGFILVMFNIIVLNKNVDILKFVTNFISTYRKYKEIKLAENDDDDDYDESDLVVDADEYEIADFEVITKDTK